MRTTRRSEKRVGFLEKQYSTGNYISHLWKRKHMFFPATFFGGDMLVIEEGVSTQRLPLRMVGLAGFIDALKTNSSPLWPYGWSMKFKNFLINWSLFRRHLLIFWVAPKSLCFFGNGPPWDFPMAGGTVPWLSYPAWWSKPRYNKVWGVESSWLAAIRGWGG